MRITDTKILIEKQKRNKKETVGGELTIRKRICGN